MLKFWWKMEKSLPSAAKSMEKLIVIGKIGAPHGVRGEVRIISLSDFPDRFESLKKVYMEDSTTLDVESMKYNKQFIIMKFKQFNERNDITPFNGKLIHVKRSEVPPLFEGEYYTFDIIGLAVYDENDELVGNITEILKTGSNDVYIVSQKGQSKQILVPALKTVVTEIDIVNGKMKIILPEELD